MRGKHFIGLVEAVTPRNIPAYAGKTWRACSCVAIQSEHPRVCGENLVHVNNPPFGGGTSPRMRGKPYRLRLNPQEKRNIPAYAGKTGGWYASSSLTTEHPRVCGENQRSMGRHRALGGTSPRMRGKPTILVVLLLRWRNIPAYAGKTLTS